MPGIFCKTLEYITYIHLINSGQHRRTGNFLPGGGGGGGGGGEPFAQKILPSCKSQVLRKSRKETRVIYDALT